MDSQILKKCIKKAFEETKTDVKHKTVKNEEKSGRFKQRVSEYIYKELYSKDEYHLNVINTKFGEDNEPGEWLLDACITDVDPKTDSRPVKRIFFAMECESQTAYSEFNQDFAKLVHIKADHKLYLQGLNQKTTKGVCDHIGKKLENSCSWLKDTNSLTESSEEFYMAFWPSPEKKEGSSIWDQFDGTFKHLDRIRLFRFVYSEGNVTFKEINQNG
ncbi:MAG: hypothetical protein OXC80_06830 [Gammaproteobacteria bacterium]|nr:hypothetical protein [Gammaproteobacteria bacterium]